MGEVPFYVDADRLTDERLRELLVRLPWWRPLQQLALRRGIELPPLASLADPWRAEASFGSRAIDAAQLLHLTADDLIDRFLGEEELRIVAEEGGPVDDVRVAAELSEDEELVSEPLAAIYAAQGLRDEAIAIYRKLSLLNPEKSVYFAELIDRLEKNN